MRNKKLNDDVASTTTVVHAQSLSPAPTFSLLFSHCTRNDIFTVLIPAIIVSLISGGVQPFMTHLIGQAFNAMAKFPSVSPTDADRHHLRHAVGFVSLELVGLAVGSLVLSSVMSGLWLRVGEITVMRVRSKVFQAVVERDIEWFDALGVSDAEKGSEGVGAGGLDRKSVV